MSESRVIATVATYDELIDALRERVRELNVSHATLDDVAGLPARYVSKLLADPAPKRLGLTSMGPLLGALGVELIVVESADAMRRIANQLDPRQRQLADGKSAPVVIRLGRRKLKRLASLGGKARAAKLSAKQRRMIARRAGRASANAHRERLNRDQPQQPIKRPK